MIFLLYCINDKTNNIFINYYTNFSNNSNKSIILL